MRNQSIPLCDIHPAENTNPRKHFDQAGIESLAESIRFHGLLQPLIVAKNGDGYTIIAGERRYRAMNVLAARGDLEPEHKVACLVAKSTPEQEREIALAENVQRENLSPLDEAEAFHALAENDGVDLDDIAARFGCSKTKVRQRLALAALPDRAKELLRDGSIDLARAQALTTGTPEKIERLLDRAGTSLHHWSTYSIRRELLADAPTVALAIFPIERYTGTFTADLFSDDGETYFDDVDQFLKLQQEALEAKAKAYEGKHAFVRIITDQPFYNVSWNYREADEDEAGGVVLHMGSNGQVEILENVVRCTKEEPDEEAGDEGDEPAAVTEQPVEEPDEGPGYTAGAFELLAAHRTVAVMAALIHDQRKALEVFVLQAIRAIGTWDTKLQIQANDALRYFDRPENHESSLPAKTLDNYAALDLKDLGIERGHSMSAWATLIHFSKKDPLTIYANLKKMEEADLNSLVALLVAIPFGPSSLTANAHSPVFEAVGADLGVDLRKNWTPNEDFFARCRKPMLEAFWKEVGEGYLPSYIPPRKKEIVDALVTFFAKARADDETIPEEVRARTNAWLPPGMGFAPPAEEPLAEAA